MPVTACPSAESAAATAAERIAALLREAIAARGAASLALSGGTTPAEMVRQLASRDVDWEAVVLFQVDERAVPVGDAARNWSMVAPLEARIPEAGRHPMPVELADGDERYASELRTTLGVPVVIDVVHLGLGPDGHTASLVPGDPALAVDDREVSWVGSYLGHRRMTLTVPVLRAARHQVWLVTGREKARPLAELVAGAGGTPAAQVLNQDATLIADAAAAAILPST